MFMINDDDDDDDDDDDEDDEEWWYNKQHLIPKMNLFHSDFFWEKT